MQSNKFPIKGLCLAAIIAALYATLTLVFQAISFGAVQFRISEAMTLLPMLFPAAVPGLTVGCLLSNLLGSGNIYDIVFGTLATLIAAVFTWRIKGNIWVKALPPVICNAVIIGFVLTYAYGFNAPMYGIAALWFNMLTVGFGQAVVCYGLGIPMIKLLKNRIRASGSPK